MTLSGLNPEAATRADSDFARAMAVPEALLALRDELPPKQWVSRDLALNRSVVVLTVAAWQAWVETYVGTALAAVEKPPVQRSNDAEYLRLLNASRPLIDLAVREMGRFSTPDAGEVCRLLRLLGDDPRPRWSFVGVGGRRSPNDVMGRLNDWVKVRHAIAHGAQSLPSVEWLGRTRRQGMAPSRISTLPSARRSSGSSPSPPAIKADAAGVQGSGPFLRWEGQIELLRGAGGGSVRRVAFGRLMAEADSRSDTTSLGSMAENAKGESWRSSSVLVARPQ